MERLWLLVAARLRKRTGEEQIDAHEHQIKSNQIVIPRCAMAHRGMTIVIL
jgi:hypothetical protein